MEGGEGQRLGVGLDLAGVHRQRIVAEPWVRSGAARGSYILCVRSDSGWGFGDSRGGGGGDEEEKEECLDEREMGIFHFCWCGSGLGVKGI